MRALCKDLGLDFSLVVFTDATAAIGICRRRGLGRVRHLVVADLWVQDKLKIGEFDLKKIPGPQNPADVLTKHVDASTMTKHMETLSLSYETGRAASAPTLTH